jgi:hypothetical protein
METDSSRSLPQEASLTRRQFSRLVAGTAAGMLAGSAASAEPQEKPMDKTPATEDPRIPILEKERGIPYTEEQRKNLPPQLKDVDESVGGLRKYPLSDGGSEPCFVFTPVMPGAKQGGKANG